LILKFSRYYLNLCLKTKNTSFMHQMFLALNSCFINLFLFLTRS
jgi:hypothetical protein